MSLNVNPDPGIYNNTDPDSGSYSNAFFTQKYKFIKKFKNFPVFFSPFLYLELIPNLNFLKFYKIGLRNHTTFLNVFFIFVVILQLLDPDTDSASLKIYIQGATLMRIHADLDSKHLRYVVTWSGILDGPVAAS